MKTVCPTDGGAAGGTTAMVSSDVVDTVLGGTGGEVEAGPGVDTTLLGKIG